MLIDTADNRILAQQRNASIAYEAINGKAGWFYTIKYFAKSGPFLTQKTCWEKAIIRTAVVQPGTILYATKIFQRRERNIETFCIHQIRKLEHYFVVFQLAHTLQYEGESIVRRNDILQRQAQGKWRNLKTALIHAHDENLMFYN